MDRIPVKVLKVWSPVRYLVKNQLISEKDVSALEVEIGQYYENVNGDASDRRNITEDIKRDAMVITYLEKENKYVRGQFESKLYRYNNVIYYRIFLLDYGNTITLKDISNLKVLPRRFVDKLSFRVVYILLPNLEPLSAGLAIDDDIKLFLSKDSEWSEAAKTFCQNIAEEYKFDATAVITGIHSFNSYNAQLYFHEEVSLNNLLLSGNFAVSTEQSGSDFGQEIPQTPCSHSSRDSYEHTFPEQNFPISKASGSQKTTPGFECQPPDNSIKMENRIEKSKRDETKSLSILEKLERKSRIMAESKKAPEQTKINCEGDSKHQVETSKYSPAKSQSSIEGYPQYLGAGDQINENYKYQNDSQNVRFSLSPESNSGRHTSVFGASDNFIFQNDKEIMRSSLSPKSQTSSFGASDNFIFQNDKQNIRSSLSPKSQTSSFDAEASKNNISPKPNSGKLTSSSFLNINKEVPRNMLSNTQSVLQTSPSSSIINKEMTSPNSQFAVPTSSSGASGHSEKTEYCKVFTFGHMKLPRWDTQKFEPPLVKALKNIGIQIATPLQNYSWSAIHRGLDVALIGPNKSGKSLSYLIPIIKLLMESTIDGEKGTPKGNGPEILILCKSFEAVSSLYSTCHDILSQDDLRYERHISVIKLNTMALTISEKSELINGCHILISTPAAVVNLLTTDSTVTNLNRVQRFVFEDGIIEEFKIRKEIKKVLECRSEGKTKSQVVDHPKFILCNKTWINEIYQFCSKTMSNPMIYISDLFEAASFVKVSCKFITGPPHKKDNKLLDIILDITASKTVVFASTENISHLKDLLESQSYSVLVARNGMSKSQVTTVDRTWRCETTSILLIDDNCYEEIKINDGKNLIHYDLPSSKALFITRYNVLLDAMHDAAGLHGGNLNEPIKADCTSSIIITEENGLAANFFKEFMRRPGNEEITFESKEVTPELEEIANKCLMERGNPELFICKNFKTFGKCNLRLSQCKFRHVLYSNLDKSSHPSQGGVKLKIIKVLCANHYYAHIISYDSEPNTKIQLQYRRLNLNLQNHFGLPVNRVTVLTPTVGMMGAIKNMDDSFSRVQVTYVSASTVEVWNLENGKHTLVNTDCLLALPEKFKELPPQAVDIVLANIRPVDESFGWHNRATELAAKLILQKELKGKILKAHGNIIWLESLKKITQLTAINEAKVDFELAGQLKKEKFAIAYPEHMALIEEKVLLLPTEAAATLKIQSPDNELKDLKDLSEEMCTSNEEVCVERKPLPIQINNAVLPIVEAETLPIEPLEAETLPIEPLRKTLKSLVKLQKSVKTQAVSREKFELNTLHSVFVPFVQSPSLIYVQKDNDDLLDKLLEEINKSQLQVLTGLVKLSEYYLAPFERDNDKTYFRCQAISFMPNNGVKMFYLDIGDTATVSVNDLRILETQFLEKLPFQAIPCSMANIAPQCVNNWNTEAGDMLWKLLSKDDLAKDVFLLATSELKHKTNQDASYEVVLFNFEKTLILNEQLVEKKVAIPVDTDFSEYALHLVPDSGDSAVFTESDASEKNPNYQSVAARVIWYETELEVVLKVMLNNVKDYNLVVEEARVEFSCLVGSRYYCNNMHLFAPVDREKVAATVYQANVLIRLLKTHKAKWGHLLVTKQKPVWLKYDVDHLDISDTDESIVPRLPFMGKPCASNKNKMPVRLIDPRQSSDSYDSEDTEHST